MDFQNMYYSINGSLVLGQKDYSQLKLRCYLCKKKSHICTECPMFGNIAGNLKMHYEKLYGKEKISIYKYF